MLMTYEICDKCGKNIPQGTGAVVLKRTVKDRAHPAMHLCEECFGEVFKKGVATGKDGEGHESKE